MSDTIALSGPALVTKAWAVAEIGHANQTRADKKTPYIAHPRRVAVIFEREYAGLYLELNGGVLPEDYYRGIAIAALHDVVEDTNVTFDDLTAQGFDSIVPELRFLTKWEGGTYLDYLLRLKREAPTLAIRVKLCDMAANLEDLVNIPNKGAAKGLKTKYELSRYILTS